MQGSLTSDRQLCSRWVSFTKELSSIVFPRALGWHSQRLAPPVSLAHSHSRASHGQGQSGGSAGSRFLCAEGRPTGLASAAEREKSPKDLYSLGLHLLKVRHCTPARSVGVTELRGLSDDAVPSRLASWTTLREAGRRGAAAADVLSVTYILRHSLLCAAWRRRRRWRWQAWDPPSAWSAAPVTYTAPFLAAPAPLPFPFPSLPLSSPLLQDTHYDTRRARNSARFPSFKIPAL